MVPVERRPPATPLHSFYSPHFDYKVKKKIIPSITENKQSIQKIRLRMGRQNYVGKVCKNRAAFKTAVLSPRNKLSVSMSRLCEAPSPPPQALRRGDPGG